MIGFISILILVEIIGRPIINVNTLPNNIESDGDSSFCFRNNKVKAAKLIPDKIAKIFPVNPSKVSSSIKKNPNPVSNMTIVIQSINDDFSPRNI